MALIWHYLLGIVRQRIVSPVEVLLTILIGAFSAVGIMACVRASASRRLAVTSVPCSCLPSCRSLRCGCSSCRCLRTGDCHHNVLVRRAASVLAGALGVIVSFVMAYPTLAAVSGGGSLLVAAFAFAVGLGAACLVHSAAKDDRVVWLLLFVVAVGLTYTYLVSLASSGSIGGRAA